MLAVHLFELPKSPLLTPRTGLNPFDLTKQCDGPLCYQEGTAIAAYLDKPETRELLGVTSPNNFTGCSRVVGQDFVARFDKYSHPTQ
jgi:hypothetical protein